MRSWCDGFVFVCARYLKKKGGTLGNWSTRYFVLLHNKVQYFVERHKVDAATAAAL